MTSRPTAASNAGDDVGVDEVVMVGEEVAVGEAQEAGVVEDDRVLPGRAEPLPVLEGRGDAGGAGIGAGDGIATAERKGVDDVRDWADGGRCEECRGRGGVAEERGGQALDVRLEGVVRRVVAAAAVAEQPRRQLRGGERRVEECEEGCGEAGGKVAAHGHAVVCFGEWRLETGEEAQVKFT